MQLTDVHWLWGDPGHPLFASQTHLQVLKVVDADLGHQITTIARSQMKLMASERRAGSANRNATEEARNEVIHLLDTEFGSDRKRLFQSPFEIRNPDLLDGLTIDSIPLLSESRSALGRTGLDGSQSVEALASIGWGELLSAGASWNVIFDISHLLECWLGGAVSRGLVPEKNPYLEDAAGILSREVAYRTGGDAELNRWGSVLVRRFGWGVPAKTLDEIGLEAGVTRERIRQIQTRLISFTRNRINTLPDPVNRVMSLDKTSFDAGLGSAMIQNGLSQSDEWAVSSISTLIRSYGHDGAATSWAFEAQKNNEDHARDALIAKRIRKARSTTGTIRIDRIPGDSGGVFLDVADVSNRLRKLYSRCFISGNYAIVSTNRGSSGTETEVMRQLGVCSPLHIDSVTEGLKRNATYRGSSASLPPTNDLMSLLQQTGRFQIDSAGMVSGEKQIVPSANVESWVAQQIADAPGCVIHKNEIIRAAISDRMGLSSVQLFMSYSSLSRPWGDGLLTLVGRSPSNGDSAFARKVADSKYVKFDVDYSVVDQSAIKVGITLGTGFFLSGVVTVPTQLATVLGTTERSIACCELQDFGGHVKVSKKTLWYGFSSLRDHLVSEHGMIEGSRLGLRVEALAIYVTSTGGAGSH